MKFIKRISVLIMMLLILALGISFLFPIGYRDYINKYALQYDIDPFLIGAIINVESKYNKNAISSKEARGLMQIGPQTGQWASEVLGIEFYNEERLFEPELNIMFGSWYLSQLNKEFSNDQNLVLAAYNAGSGNVSKWLKDEDYCNDGVTLDVIPFKETEDYLERVNTNYKVYSRLYKNRMFKSQRGEFEYIDLISSFRNNFKKLINFLERG